MMTSEVYEYIEDKEPTRVHHAKELRQTAQAITYETQQRNNNHCSRFNPQPKLFKFQISHGPPKQSRKSHFQCNLNCFKELPSSSICGSSHPNRKCFKTSFISHAIHMQIFQPQVPPPPPHLCKTPLINYQKQAR